MELKCEICWDVLVYDIPGTNIRCDNCPNGNYHKKCVLKLKNTTQNTNCIFCKQDLKVNNLLETPNIINTPLVNVDDCLYDIIQIRHCTRALIHKKIWEYITSNNLQKPGQKMIIVPDLKLSKIIGHQPINMFLIARLVNQHIID
jgi:DNA topoisomerase-1